MVTKEYMRNKWARGKELWVKFKGESEYTSIGNVYDVRFHDDTLFYNRINHAYYATVDDNAELDYQQWLCDVEYIDMDKIEAFAC